MNSRKCLAFNDQNSRSRLPEIFPFRAGRRASMDDQEEVRISLGWNPAGDSTQIFADVAGQIAPFNDRVASSAEFESQAGLESFSPALSFFLQPLPDQSRYAAGQFLFVIQSGILFVIVRP